MRAIVFLLLAHLLLVGCEPRGDEYTNADWKPLAVPTRIDLTDVFFVTEDVGFIAGEGVDSVFTSEIHNWGDLATWFAWQKEPHATNGTPNLDRHSRGPD